MILPPSVTGKTYGYLKITVGELVWWRNPLLSLRDHGDSTCKSCHCYTDIIVKTKWWGSDKVVSFR